MLIFDFSCEEDGIYQDSEHHPSTAPVQPHEPSATPSPFHSAQTSPKSKHHVLLTIPSKVISRAVGLAIFTTARAGFHISGAAGSGVLVARLPDGSWSPPSGIQVHTLGAGFLIGIDIYDCVCVINTREALDSFMKTRLSLGPELSVAIGPFGVGGRMDFAAPTKQHGTAVPEQSREHVQKAAPDKVLIQDANTLTPAKDALGGRKRNERKLSPLREALNTHVYSYVNSRGFYAGIQVDGTVITERKDANAAFYGENIPIEKILRGEVPAQGPAGMWPVGARMLLEALKGAVAWKGSHVAGVESGVQEMNLRDHNNIVTAKEE
jgi:SH3 domain-containing YSC84-like protein 1